MSNQGTQVPMYTKHTLFLYIFFFSDFSISFFYFYIKNKIIKTEKQTNKNMLKKAKHKTRLTQNSKAKYTRYANQNKKIERTVRESLGALFLPHLGGTFPLIKPLNRR